MRFEFDPAKDAVNRLKHGVSLSEGGNLELDETTVTQDERRHYGEARFRAFGRIAGKGYCLVFTTRGDAIRLISLRRAREKEMRRYGR